MQLLKLLVYGNIWISLCAICCLETSLLLLGKSVNKEIYFVVFLGTFCAYQISFLGLKNPTSDKFKVSAQQLKLFKITFWISFLILLLFCLTYLSIYQLVFLSHLALIAVIYTIGIPKSFKFNIAKYFIVKPLRLFPFQKTLWVSYVWASLTVVFPFCEILPTLNYQFFMFFVARFLLLWSLTLPFDIRDATIDKQAGLQTIFLGLGKQKYVIFVSSVLLISLALHTKLFYNYFIVFVIIHCSILLLNFYAKEKNHELYFTGLLDGILVFEFLVLVIEKYLV